jgi:hypothetical protein
VTEVPARISFQAAGKDVAEITDDAEMIGMIHSVSRMMPAMTLVRMTSSLFHLVSRSSGAGR